MPEWVRVKRGREGDKFKFRYAKLGRLTVFLIVLVRLYDFYSRVVKDCKRTSERSERVSLAIFHNKCIIKIVQANQP